LIRELEALLGRKVRVVSERGLRPRVMERVMREAIPVETRPGQIAGHPRGNREYSDEIDSGRDAFLQDELLQVWAVHHIQSIGEAAASISADLIDRYPQMPWTDIISMRNVLVHRIFRYRRE